MRGMIHLKNLRFVKWTDNATVQAAALPTDGVMPDRDLVGIVRP